MSMGYVQNVVITLLGEKLMIERTPAEIEAKITEVFKSTNTYEEPEKIEITGSHTDGWTVNMSRMYNPPGLSFQHLLELAKFFDTTHIDSRPGDSYGGCESCDYGSSYSVDLKVGP